MNEATIGTSDSHTNTMSCPSPPRKRPAPPDPEVRRFSRKKSGLLRSATSIGVDEMLLGQESTCSPSLDGVAPMPPLKKKMFV